MFWNLEKMAIIILKELKCYLANSIDHVAEEETSRADEELEGSWFGSESDAKEADNLLFTDYSLSRRRSFQYIRHTSSLSVSETCLDQ